MERLKETEAKMAAMKRAQANGHEMRPWRRHPGYRFRNRSSCQRCGRALIINSGMLARDEVERMLAAGDIIGRWERAKIGCRLHIRGRGRLRILVSLVCLKCKHRT